ncbi:1,4-dihydroxy-2-naphthoate octaprenyltransferase [Moheibacter lacus]|uniref:1,4-dihydroxy-2-naphthoate octaprenyltransferase n=1 Tax=Moheibacter lacus TaxID=2745851 RepID=A0A838ZFV2_9FLAO|nr:1,4-dihydroxy-2-naphthoate octaprenyltransferase [Moheibacter lacus]MBA5628601.1 1,4-dihydroxy-2-naphthoate octaprenyltransferase [Moheibacter lacus]
MKKWIAAARLRTLPLSISGIILGSLIALSEGHWNWAIFGLAFLTTLFLQVLSNYANDYGDGIKGTDAERIGEKRAVASGEISAKQMKNAVILFSVLSAVTAFLLIYISFKENFLWALLFIFLTFACVWAAIRYTVGKSAYGYAGMGDIFVFAFFGIISVWGSYTLYQHETFHPSIFLPAAAIGLLSTAVLNLNNLRDIETDRKAGKLTLPLRMGFQNGKIYQSTLILLPFILSVIYLFQIGKTEWFRFSFLILLIPASLFLKTLFQTNEPRLLDKELKKVALMTLAFSLLLGSVLTY